MCYENRERFFRQAKLMKTLKAEEVNGKASKPIEEARGNIGIFIDRIYNRRRLHSAIKPNSASTADISA